MVVTASGTVWDLMETGEVSAKKLLAKNEHLLGILTRAAEHCHEHSVLAEQVSRKHLGLNAGCSTFLGVASRRSLCQVCLLLAMVFFQHPRSSIHFTCLSKSHAKSMITRDPLVHKPPLV